MRSSASRDWAKEMADELAAAGYIVIAPDLLSGSGPNGGGSDPSPVRIPPPKPSLASIPNRSTPTSTPQPTMARSFPPPTASLRNAGFCWGGGKSFAFATHRKDLSAAFVFYGPPPTDVLHHHRSCLRLLRRQ